VTSGEVIERDDLSAARTIEWESLQETECRALRVNLVQPKNTSVETITDATSDGLDIGLVIADFMF
jgi:hypothetical protein